MRKTFLALALTIFLAGAAPAQELAQKHFDGQSWWSHVKVLADDNMEGRETGSAGLRRAEAYVVEQITKAGLEPAGTEGYYQSVKFAQRQIDEKNSAAALVRDGKSEPLVLGDDGYFSTRGDLGPEEITAPLVFVGYGLKIPEKNLEEFAGLDLKGKIVVYITGSPADIPGPLSAAFGSISERWKALKETGAIGFITIPNPASQEIPWSRITLNRTHPTMDLAGAEFNETAGLQLTLIFNAANAEKLFAGSGHTFGEIAALAKERRPLPHFALPSSLKAHRTVLKTELESANVVAKVPGSDPVLKNEYVVMSAHIDHVGIGEPINGDRIYNGAMDNGSGSALLIDLAAELKVHPEKLRRSILFVFVTGEEKGLLGSKYFAAHPTVAPKSMIANINTDMFLPIIPLKVMVIEGLAESDLGDRSAAVVQSFGVKPIADPLPLHNFFVRSDQYSFVRHGVPAVALEISAEPHTPEEKIVETWLANRYHAPSDDISQPVNLASAALYEEIIRKLMINTANADVGPQWKPDSFFRRFAPGGND
jgi:Zn-dependent M28 family amino/carboxypeptidase